jgi:hypothetical protein
VTSSRTRTRPPAACSLPTVALLADTDRHVHWPRLPGFVGRVDFARPGLFLPSDGTAFALAWKPIGGQEGRPGSLGWSSTAVTVTVSHGPQRKGAEDLVVEFVLVGGAPDADPAEFSDGAPRASQVAGGGQFVGTGGFGGAAAADFFEASASHGP